MIVWQLLFRLMAGYPAYELLMVLIVAVMLWYLTREHGKRSISGAKKPKLSTGRKP